MPSKIYKDSIIIGAGAAGMMCGITLKQRSKNAIILEHTSRIGEKIRISGGGRCNFTNLYTAHKNFISKNPNFAISALKQYTQHDFIKMMIRYNIPYHEKKLGQLFCDKSAIDIINMLEDQSPEIHYDIKINEISRDENNFIISTNNGDYIGRNLIIATGGLSIPKIGATDFGYRVAKQFDHKIINTTPALVPLTLDSHTLAKTKSLAGVSQNSITSFGKTSFEENILFTHRGLSGPAILQISSYWNHKDPININLSPDKDVYQYLIDARKYQSKQDIKTLISDLMSKNLALYICDQTESIGCIADFSNQKIQNIANYINRFSIIPNGTEGFAKAEVTLGGVDTSQISSQTMESKIIKNLYFIGEVVDVTGHLGGFNFQWAWSSGFAAGRHIE